MRQALKLHPDCVCPPVERIEVEAVRWGGLLLLLYRIVGAVADLRLPPPSGPARASGLWKHTCFEVFVGTPADYLEVNLSPSGAWAAYRFDGYRSGMGEAGMGVPWIVTTDRADRFELHAEVQIMRWEGRIGLSAVVEERGGRLSYWALAHPPGEPDFHHPDCFVLELPPAGPA